MLVYDAEGNCVGSFGQPTRETPNNAQFRTVGGIATDAEGNVYVSDAGVGRVLKFAPFPAQAVPPAAEATEELPAGGQQGEVEIMTEEVTEEAPVEAATEELTPELTTEADAAG